MPFLETLRNGLVCMRKRQKPRARQGFCLFLFVVIRGSVDGDDAAAAQGDVELFLQAAG